MATNEQKHTEYDQQHEVLEQKYNQLLKEKLQWLENEEKMKSEIATLKAVTNSPVMNQHDGDFWNIIKTKCVTDPEYIKNLVKNKVLSVHDRSPLMKRTLLLQAAFDGSYELVQFCLNNGADISVRDWRNKTALQFARERGHFHFLDLF